MIHYAAECYNSGFFSILAVVLNEEAPGYKSFYSQSIDSWNKLGVDEEAITNVILNKRFAKDARDALREDLPILVEKSFSDKGRSLYELGFWIGTIFLALLSNLTSDLENWLNTIKYKCAEIGNPELLVNFVKTSVEKMKQGNPIDIMEVAKTSEELHLWIIANIKLDKKKNFMDVLFNAALEDLPHGSNLIKALIGYFKNKGKKRMNPI